jgi:ribosomal protein S18 acetylase RimI-like enzyme
MHARPYRAADRNHCLDCFDSNASVFFAPEQRIEFEQFLDRQPPGYYVVHDGDDVIGCGGSQDDGDTATLAWIMVLRDRQRQGAGSLLITSCMLDILALPRCRAATVECNQHAAAYFERWGFGITSTFADGYAPGIDRVAMGIGLDDDNRALWDELTSGGLTPPETEQPIPAIEQYEEWTTHRYDPGYYLGGQLAPHLDTSRMGPHAKRKSAILLGISALISTIGYSSMTSIDDNRWVRLAGTAIVVFFWVAAARMFLSSRQDDRRSK